MSTIDLNSLVPLLCPDCGVVFAITDNYYYLIRRSGGSKTFYCPNGHGIHYQGRSEG